MALMLSSHALRRMFERGITLAMLEQVVNAGQVIQNYPEDLPYPSRLILSFVDGKPLHAVVTGNAQSETIVITVYEPSPELWEADMKRKR
jgi:hypothetical protein